MTEKKLLISQRLSYEKDLCERNFVDFIRLAWQHIDPAPYVHNWHVETLADHLQACAEGRINRLLINISPGTAKSTILVLFSAWLWVRNPSLSILSASYSEKNALHDALRTKRLIESQWFQRLWPLQIMGDQNAKSKFENSHMGRREARPFESLTGGRADCLIIDDPHSVDDAKSAARRNSAVSTFLSAIPNRVNDLEKSCIIVVMQRLHEDDVSGAILQRPALGYTHLCIPMIADDPADRIPTTIGWVDHRKAGELMFPTKFPMKHLDAIKASMGPLQFAGQYQQQPAPDTDGFFIRDWFKRYKPEELPQHVRYYMTSDHAPSGNNDYNVFRIWAIDHNRALWLVDSFRRQCLMDEALGLSRDSSGKIAIAPTGAFALIQKYKPAGWFPENDGTWAAIKGMVESAMLETRSFVNIQPLPTKGSGDKIGKAVAYQAMAAMGQVHLPVGPIGDIALEEYAMFPAGRRDDQVDADSAIARASAELIPAWIPTVEPVRKRSMWEDEQDYSSSDDCWG
ncbi:hypothetical protein OKW76_00445 [Sphingomonas sp. S1-29]|uniref:hypothetical protein n=1 Tax=Sphingomonas sp. S1-29 TaxID=2991074 RepID=UPI0022407D8D|nr:hypothetical protein [Sphingomonas sp. S1-29]UZK69594.1 hypothetical protein OKW76_00445 [Sphingomonas sp. S1-29]